MTKRNRRQFLEDSMFAAAAAVSVGAGTTLHAEEQDKKSSPNDKLNVAVIGVNGQGRSHLGAYVGHSGTDVTHICDADAEVGNRQVERIAFPWTPTRFSSS